MEAEMPVANEKNPQTWKVWMTSQDLTDLEKLEADVDVNKSAQERMKTRLLVNKLGLKPFVNVDVKTGKFTWKDGFTLTKEVDTRAAEQGRHGMIFTFTEIPKVSDDGISGQPSHPNVPPRDLLSFRRRR